jgi:glycosyltransferase involved in cell wall biosynthesis
LRFLFVGDGILREPLKRQVRQAGLEGYFEFTGLVPPGDIPAILGAIDMVVHTSIREGLARVLPQALIAGKPVVSYDIDGAREVVLPNETGVLLEPGDVIGLAEALVQLAGDPQLRQRLGSCGRAKFTDQFRHERMTAELRALYERILVSKRRS